MENDYLMGTGLHFEVMRMSWNETELTLHNVMNLLNVIESYASKWLI